MSRKVTEEDFRLPEYRGAKPEDYEFRSDGKLVRKDRWETAVQSIRYLVGIESREFEISEVVDAVRNMATQLNEEWVDLSGEDYIEYPDSPDHAIELKLNDESILKSCVYVDKNWYSHTLKMNIPSDKILAWKTQDF